MFKCKIYGLESLETCMTDITSDDLPVIEAFTSNMFSPSHFEYWKQVCSVIDRVGPVVMIMESLKSLCVSAVIPMVFELSLKVMLSLHFPGLTSGICNWNTIYSWYGINKYSLLTHVSFLIEPQHLIVISSFSKIKYLIIFGKYSSSIYRLSKMSLKKMNSINKFSAPPNWYVQGLTDTSISFKMYYIGLPNIW